MSPDFSGRTVHHLRGTLQRVLGTDRIHAMADDRALERALRTLPSVDEALRTPEILSLLSEAPRWAVTAAIRQEIEARRQSILAGGKGEGKGIDSTSISRSVDALLQPAIRPVINATGVVVHTNLGRAPLARAVLDRLVEVALGYSNLEYELDRGRRGSRHEHLRKIARDVCGAEDAVITNNNASAVLLAVSAIAAEREVIVSRGELVEIGGGFRIPDVIVQGGAILHEVGTTNRTHVADYEGAIGPNSAALLKVHKSNFDVVGFTEETTVEQLSKLARAAGLPLIVDLGSGAMVDSYGPGLTGEPVVRRALDDGADVICFSGDKLFGGPQAGIILGCSNHVETIRRHPLMRAVRPCKLTLAALEATFELWRDERRDEIPTARMLALDPEGARRRTLRFRRRVIKVMGEPWTVEVLEVMGRAGGGSMPLRTAPGWGVALRLQGLGPGAIEAALRDGSPPVIARIIDDKVVLDLRTVMRDQEASLLTRLEQVAKTLG